MSDQPPDETAALSEENSPGESPTENPLAETTFASESPEVLKVNVDGHVWGRVGTMIARTGNITFKREGVLNQGLTNFIKKQLTGEKAPLMRMEGQGQVYLADRKKKISFYELGGERVSVSGNDLLAFEDGMEWSINAMTSGAGGLIASGLFNVSLVGTGRVAVTSHGEPLTLEVEAGTPVYTDPQATVAWSGSLAPSTETDVSAKALFGRGSGEMVQLKFEGDGWVLLQPYEEAPFQRDGQQQA